MKALRNNSSGSVLIEGVYAVFTLVLAIVFNLELFRRMNYEKLVEQAAFIRARDKVMGVHSQRSQKKICELFQNAFVEGQSLCNSMEIKERVGGLGIESVFEEIVRADSEGIIQDRVFKKFSNEKSIRGVIASSHIDYKQLIKFEWENPRNHYKKEMKHDLEITKSCPYPTSSY